MNTTQIRKMLTGDPYAKTVFKGVFPCDKLPKVISEFPCAFVANTDHSGEGGEHWVCYYFDENGNAEYFDSYGIQPVNCELFKFWKGHGKNHSWNTVQLQGMKSTVCGQWCVAFITNRARGCSLSTFVNRFRGKDVNNENSNSGKYDKWVQRVVNSVFNIRKLKTVKQDGGHTSWLQCCCARNRCKRF
jgi:hypothetical protein